MSGAVRSDDLPGELQGWLPLPAECSESDDSLLLINCLTGPPARIIDDWIQTAAVAHLVEWQRDATVVAIDPEDRILPAGAEATRWIFDRFTQTSLAEWRRTSLDWELAFTHSPQAVADRLELSISTISERPVSQPMVVQALSRRVTSPGAGDVVLADMTASEIVQNLVALTCDHNFQDALTLATRAVHESPTDPNLRLAWAFLLIAGDPADAERRLRAMERVPYDIRGLFHANLAAALLRQGRSDDARHETKCVLGSPDIDARLGGRDDAAHL